ncbi:MAG: cation diffusion facilitator family transporter [Bacteroidota bacterium]
MMNQTERTKQLFAIRLSLAIGLLMLAGKWYAYAITGSSAILSDAAESVVHVLAVLFAAYSMWLSLRPADASHPYGHGKVAYFSVGIEGALIVIAAFYIIYDALRKLFGPIVLSNLDTGIYIVVGALVVNLFLGGYLLWRGKKSHSLILVANAKHVLTDSWTSFGVVLGLALALWTGWLPFDPLVAIVVALNIVWSGGKLVRQSVGGLMDEGDPELELLIRRTLDTETANRNLRYHELRYRHGGTGLWVEFHLLFPGSTPLERAHRDATEIEMVLTKAVPTAARIVSHLEPVEEHERGHTQQLRH